MTRKEWKKGIGNPALGQKKCCVCLLFLKTTRHPTCRSWTNHLSSIGHILYDFIFLSWLTHIFILIIQNVCPSFMIIYLSRAQLESFFRILPSCFVHSPPCLAVIICLPICLLHWDLSSWGINVKPPVILQCLLHCEHLLVVID